jgi:hypothetical protein
MKAEEQKKQKEMMMQMKEQAHSRPKVQDPTIAEIDNSYFIKHKPGEEGLKQVDAEMTKKKAEYAAYQSSVAAAHKSANPEPSKTAPTPPQ